MAETSTALPPEIAPEVPPEVLAQALAQAAEDAAASDANQEEAAEARLEPVPAPAEVVLAQDVAQDNAPEVLDLPPPIASATGQVAAERGIALAPERFDIVEIGTTVARYMRGEGEAAVAHLRALSSARSPAEIIRLQVGEAQRAADASLSCWVTVIGKASRVVSFR